MPALSEKPRLIFLSCLLVVCGWLAYGDVMSLPFVHDDWVFLKHNPDLHQWNWSDIFLRSSISQAPALVNAYYRPGLDILYRLIAQGFGVVPGPYHGVNLIGHLVNGILVFFLIRGWLRCMAFEADFTGGLPQDAVAFLTALLFVWHPVQVEAVAAVAGISNIAFSFFVLAALVVILYGGSPVFRAGSGVLWAMALLCKEQAVMLPIWLLFFFALNWHKGGEEILQAQRGFRPSVGPTSVRTSSFCASFANNDSSRLLWIGLIATATAYAGLRGLADAGSGVGSVFQHPAELWLRIRAIPQRLMMDLQALFWPMNLHYYRSCNILEFSWFPVVGLAALAAALGWIRRKMSSPDQKVFLLGIGWFLLWNLPTLNILPLVHEFSWIAAFEHFLYLPSLGIFFLAAWIGVRLFSSATGRSQRWGVGVLFGLIWGGCGMMTRPLIPIWSGDRPLFERVARYEPRLGRVQMLLGKAYFQEQRYEEAMAAFKRASDIFSSYADKVQDPAVVHFYQHMFLKESLRDYGRAALAARQPAQAEAAWRRARALGGPVSPGLNNDLAVLALWRQDPVEAERLLKEGLEAAPEDARLLRNLGLLYWQTGRRDEGAVILRKALKVQPGQKDVEAILSGSGEKSF